MTNYHLTPPSHPLPYYEARERRVQRRRQLAAVRARRKVIYAQFTKKRLLQPPSDLATIVLIVSYVVFLAKETSIYFATVRSSF